MAAGSVVMVEVPEYMAFDASTSSEGWSCADGVCSLTVGDVEGGVTGELMFGVTVAEELPADLGRLEIWAAINATSGAESSSRNNRDRSVTPIEAVVEQPEFEEETGDEGVV